jgi:hypothetical protein
MTLYDIYIMVRDNLGMGTLFVIVILSLVEVSKIKINPLSFIGNVLNRDIRKKMDSQAVQIAELSDKVSGVDNELKEDKAMSARYRIIRFEDEIRHDVLHTKEHYDQIIIDIDTYEKFCKKNIWQIFAKWLF